jgi:hypothetical protein
MGHGLSKPGAVSAVRVQSRYLFQDYFVFLLTFPNVSNAVELL